MVFAPLGSGGAYDPWEVTELADSAPYRESLSKHVDLFARIKQLGGGF
jgi:hypothetical protein